MGYRSRRIIQRGTLLSILMLLAPTPPLVSSESAHFIENTTPYGRADWTTGIATAHGIGIPPKEAVSPLQAREMARTAAWEVARRNLLDVIKGVHIDSTTTVNNSITTNDEVQAKVEGFVRGARLVKEQEMPDGSYETTVEMKLGGEFSKLVIPKIAPKSAPLAQYQKKSSGKSMPKSYTGLVVDARGLGARPALAPRLLTEQGAEAYSIAYVEPQVTAKEGIVLYTPDPASAQNNPRVIATPLVIKASRADGADLYITDADAQTIHGVPEHFKFLKQAKVLVILEQNEQK